MTKRQIIDEIIVMNQTAEPAFLAKFDDAELNDYLRHLRLARRPRLTGNTAPYEKYFADAPKASPVMAHAVVEAAPAQAQIQQEVRQDYEVEYPADDDLPTESVSYEAYEAATVAPTYYEEPEIQDEQASQPVREEATAAQTVAAAPAQPEQETQTPFAPAERSEKEPESWLF